ncbi:MAG: 4-phosphopantoate--beta-alanine ligase [Methanocellales archaeon]
MTEIPKDHPRYTSLVTREKLVESYQRGIVSIQGLIAQGRGEAFDYILGEKTIESANQATKAAAALLLLAKKPVISVNGNAAALAGSELVILSKLLNAPIEVNLFHRTDERVKRIMEDLRQRGGALVLGAKADARIPGISHERAKVDREGIYSADVVFVPLEDGDRCEALIKMGKKVIAVDLNPLCRTARTATITIVDNIIRAVPNLIKAIQELKNLSVVELERIVRDFDNNRNLQLGVLEIDQRLRALASEQLSMKF